jgi:outer membrane lipoprotein-sorting protein
MRLAMPIARRIQRRALLAGALLLALAPAAPAAPPKAAALSEQDHADLGRIETYLNGIRTMAARFQQFSPNGGTAGGLVYLSRPGKMRFEYDPPSPILIGASGSWVVYIDSKLKEITYLPVGSTPAWFLLRDKVSLTDGVTVTRFERGPNALRVTLVQTKSPEDGSLTLVFSDHPLELRQWVVLDPQGQQTTVALSEARFGIPVNPDLFVFNDPNQRGKALP